MKVYHGTTQDQLRSCKTGLRKETFVSPDLKVAKHFAIQRSLWNNQRPVILVLEAEIKNLRRDRNGFIEAQLKQKKNFETFLFADTSDKLRVEICYEQQQQ